mmetsp:Transcript_5583/g.10555  ORF Transcript_5583/g.10555 Transcript_5583/m.10555 type:complete len:588 (+) Transcript_5583:136-1899(+)
MLPFLLGILLIPSSFSFTPARDASVRLTAIPASVEASSTESTAPTGLFASPKSEIARRRNLAIIAHPDAGKTTLTEKLLLYGGALQQAGAVRTRADQRAATSDWMELEKQRGISITSTVLTFDYQGNRINLLDTPGHQDFSEDTYRTLAACDNAVCLIDAAKGLEPQTRKLLEVCRLSKLPIFTFCNKLDRPSLEPLELIDQIENEFGLTCFPVVWPIGDGAEFQGVLDRSERTVHLFERGDRTGKATNLPTMALDDPDLEKAIGERLYLKLMEDVELLDGIISPLDKDKVLKEEQTPMFFGSAMNNFGVELFLKKFLHMGTTPQAMDMNGGSVSPHHPEFSGFVFKLQANLDPKHRDRLAYVRIVSGRYEKGMKVSHSRSKRQLTLSQAQNLFATEREAVLEAFPGDVIGINNPSGLLSIGDALFTGNDRISFKGIPSFSPEVFAYVSNPNPSKYKNYRKGLSELLEEGAVNLLRDRNDDGNGQPILAAVGQLQFDVVQHRMQSEYGVETKLDPFSFNIARWAEGGWPAVDKALEDGKLFGCHVAKDRWERPVLLFRNEWKVSQLRDSNDEHGLGLAPCATAPVFD